MAPHSALGLPNLRVEVLANGLKVLIQEVHAAPLVSVWSWYRVGSGDESPGLTGVSHWVEHMNFKGTAGIPRAEMTAMIERHGGTWNGYTWVDQTTYLETTTRDALDEMLFLESERMVHGLYEPAECEAERSVIVSELQGGENDPDQLLETELTATALKVHPYRHPTIGWLTDLRKMSRDDLYAHYRRYYVPNNAALVIAGDIDATDALRLVERRFGAIAPSPVPLRRRVEEPPQVGERRLTISREGTTAYFKAAFRAPAFQDPDFLPMLVLDAVLSGAKGISLWASFRHQPPQRQARLYRALVDGGLASAVGGALLPTRDPFLYTISVTPLEGVSLEQVEEATLGEIERVRRLGIKAAELDRAKRQLRARMVLESESITNIAHQIGFFECLGSLDLLRNLPERLEAVSRERVMEVAERNLGAIGRSIGWFRPLPGWEEAAAPEETARRIAAIRGRTSS